MSATKQNLVIEKGATYAPAAFVFKDSAGNPIDLTNYTAKLEMRETPYDTAFLKASSEVVPPAGFTKYITLGTTNGNVAVVLPATVTDLFKADTAFYDIELTSGAGVVTRFMQGRVHLSRSITTD